MNQVFLITLVIIFYISSRISQANIFLPDSRISIIAEKSDFYGMQKRPFKMLVRLSNGCSGSLVGKNLALTAAHCVLDKEGRHIKGITITAYNGETASALNTHWGTSSPKIHRNEDWAIIELDKNIGTDLGFFGYKTNIDTNSQYILAGYPTDKEGLVADVGCSYRGFNHLHLHDCDFVRGNSGGPIFYCSIDENDCWIVGIAVAEKRNGGDKSLTLSNFSFENANILVPTSSFGKKVSELRAKGVKH